MDRPFSDKRPIGPFLQTKGDNTERLIAELESMVESEEEAKSEYSRVIMMLENQGYTDMAEQVRDIRDDEIRHGREFRSMISTIRRDTS